VCKAWCGLEITLGAEKKKEFLKRFVHVPTGGVSPVITLLEDNLLVLLTLKSMAFCNP
jgi:hypothetical protein